jgi:hypothetical protein
MNKKIYLLLLFVIFSFCIPSYAFADDGICGDNMQWSLNEQGTLTITGTGSMYDYHVGSDITGLSEPPWYEYADKIENIIVSDGVKSLGDNAFFLCKNVKSVVLPDSITQLGNGLFANCQSLETISLPDNIETLPASIFVSCTSLKNVKLPANLKKIEINAFADSGIRELNLPESLNEIESGVFKMSRIRAIKLPDNIYSISGNTFEDARDLQFVIFPKNLKNIDEQAFHNCVSLHEIYLPDGLETIGQYAFLGCSSVEKIYIPESVTNIGFNAFFSGVQGVRNSNPVIYGFEGSAAKRYAKEEDFEFVPLTKEEYDEQVNTYETSSIYKPTIVVSKNNKNINISIGTEAIDFKDTEPFADSSGHTQIPLRFVAEAVGASVLWQGDNQTVIIEKDGIKTELYIGTNKILKDNKEVLIDTAPFIMNDRTFISLYSIKEIFGYNVIEIDDYEVKFNG